MADIVDKATRSRMMSGIRGKDTKPEMMVRKGLHALGLRYILNVGKLPGKPDLVFPKHQTALFVHGCFWHWHDCPAFRMPSSNQSFWREKIGSNRLRDQKNISALKSLGWKTLVVWECEIKKAVVSGKFDNWAKKLAKRII